MIRTAGGNKRVYESKHQPAKTEPHAEFTSALESLAVVDHGRLRVFCVVTAKIRSTKAAVIACFLYIRLSFTVSNVACRADNTSKRITLGGGGGPRAFSFERAFHASRGYSARISAVAFNLIKTAPATPDLASDSSVCTICISHSARDACRRFLCVTCG